MLRILAIVLLASSYASANWGMGSGAGWAGGNQGGAMMNGWAGNQGADYSQQQQQQQGGALSGWGAGNQASGQQAGWAGNQAAGWQAGAGQQGWDQSGAQQQGQQQWAQQQQNVQQVDNSAAQQVVAQDNSGAQQDQGQAQQAQQVFVADNSGAQQQQQVAAQDNSQQQSAAVVSSADVSQSQSGAQQQVSSGDQSSGVSAGASAGPALSESQLYGNVDMSQFTAGYGNAKQNTVERVDETPQQLQDVVDQAQGQETSQDVQFPDSNMNNRFDNTKEIHSYSTQRHITNRLDKNLRRYFKNLNVNSVYNTNIARVRHQKLINLLNVQVQDVHKPFLKVAYSRQDTVNDMGARDEQPIVENQATSAVLAPIVYPAVIQRVGYNGNLMSRGVGLNYGGGNGGQAMSMYTSENGY